MPDDIPRSSEAIPRALIEEAAQLFERLGQEPQSESEVPEALSRLAEEATSRMLDLRERYGQSFNAKLLESLAASSGSLGKSLGLLGEAGVGGVRRLLVAGAEAVGSAVELSRALVQTVESLPRDPPGEQLEIPLRKVLDKIGAGANEIFQAAIVLAESLGMPIDEAGFDWPRERGCACCKCPGDEVKRVAAGGESGPGQARREINPDDVAQARKELIITLLKFFLLLRLLSRYMTGTLAYFDDYYYQACSDDCTGPTNTIVAIKRAKSYSSQDGTATPLCDADVDLCCENPCLVIWTELDAVTKPVVGVKVGRAMGAGREAAAAAVAAGAAAMGALIRAIRAAPPVC